MKTVNIHEAKTTLSALLNDVEHGEDVTIARNGVPVAKLVPVVVQQAREPGVLSDAPGWQDFVYDPTLFAPMTDKELVEEGWL